MKANVRTLKILCSPCQSSVDYGNTIITSMHLYPRRRNVAAEVAEELKTVTYATPILWRNAEEEKNRKKIRIFRGGNVGSAHDLIDDRFSLQPWVRRHSRSAQLTDSQVFFQKLHNPGLTR